jgi:hypothetical protein
VCDCGPDFLSQAFIDLSNAVYLLGVLRREAHEFFFGFGADDVTAAEEDGVTP